MWLKYPFLSITIASGWNINRRLIGGPSRRTKLPARRTSANIELLIRVIGAQVRIKNIHKRNMPYTDLTTIITYRQGNPSEGMWQRWRNVSRLPTRRGQDEVFNWFHGLPALCQPRNYCIGIIWGSTTWYMRERKQHKRAHRPISRIVCSSLSRSWVFLRWHWILLLHA